MTWFLGLRPKLINVYNDKLWPSLGLATKYIIPKKYDIVSVLDEKNYE